MSSNSRLDVPKTGRRGERKSHAKSRNGCTNCKRRHVKCDEGGPPCANCIVRESKDTCHYGPGARPSPPRLERASLSSSSGESQLGHFSPSPSQDLVHRTANRRILELELMHQWATSTYKGFVCTEPDIHTMQVELPRWCLKHEYLMNGLLAVSALELAMTSHDQDPMKQAMYLQYAMEYYDRGSLDFRSQIHTITEGNSTELYMFSTVAWVVSIATPPGAIFSHEASILERTLGLLDLIMGSSLIASESIMWMMKGPLSSSLTIVIKSFAEVGEEDWFPADAEEIFKKLAYLSEQTIESVILPRGKYAEILKHLRLVYREEMNCRVNGSAMAFPTIAGPTFAAACKNMEPLALMVLGIWGVMCDKLDKVDHVWWAKDGGMMLVDDITTRLLHDQSEIGRLTEFWECVDWLRMKVELPVFSSIPL